MKGERKRREKKKGRKFQREERRNQRTAKEQLEAPGKRMHWNGRPLPSKPSSA